MNKLICLIFSQLLIIGVIFLLQDLLTEIKSSLPKDENNNPKKQLRLRLVMSTMTRATETANIILSHLQSDDSEIKDGLDVQHCDLIQEGAPVMPVPPISPQYWDPEPHVSYGLF